MDALSLPWEELDAYAFPPVSLLGQVVSTVVDQGCQRMFLIAPGCQTCSGSGQPVGSSSTVATTGGKSADSAFQRVPSQGPFQPESACLAPRAESIQQ